MNIVRSQPVGFALQTTVSAPWMPAEASAALAATRPLHQATVQARSEPRLQPLTCCLHHFLVQFTAAERPQATGATAQQPSRRRLPPPYCLFWHPSCWCRYWKPTCIDGGGSLRPACTPAAQAGDGLVALFCSSHATCAAQFPVVTRLYEP